MPHWIRAVGAVPRCLRAGEPAKSKDEEMSEKSDDRELLELAAKAAGIEGYADQDHV